MVIVAVCVQCQIILPGVELYLIEQGTDGAGGQQAVKMPLLEVGDTQRPARDQQNIMPIAKWQEKCSSRKRPQKKLQILYICTNRTLLTFPASTSNSRARQAS